MAAPSGPMAIVVPAADGVAEIQELFWSHVREQRLTPGASLAVYAHGTLVLDLLCGYADTQLALPVVPDSLFPMFSGSKPFAAVSLWQQIERGHITLDTRVAEIWPAFGQHGKENVRVRHVLCHEGGFPTTPDTLPPEVWGDHDRVRQDIEMLAPEFEPGTVSSYHFLTQHWAIAELIRLLDGRDYDRYLHEEILDPLGLFRTHLSVTPEQETRIVKLHATDGADDWGIEVIRSTHDHPIYRNVVPGGSVVSDAAGMARFYAALALGGSIDGVRVLRQETIDRMLAAAVMDQIDPSFDLAVRRCYGFELGGQDEPRRHWPGITSTVQTFWHGGMGTSVCWADRDSGLAVAYLTNGMRRDKAGAVARRDLSDAIRRVYS